MQVSEQPTLNFLSPLMKASRRVFPRGLFTPNTNTIPSQLHTRFIQKAD